MKLLKNTKSQAALEFLTTYGWAFLVILIMIGTLAYFGVLSPSKVLPNRCLFGAEFQCLDHQISTTAGTFKFKLKNNAGDSINVDAGKITPSTESTTAVSCGASSAITSWKGGEIKEISLSCTNFANVGIVAGEKGKILVTIEYYSVASGGTYSKQVKGEVYSSVI